ncbi:MAG TPA: ATP-binding cassette domain-containing protein [Candidatus Eisenbacteria bacterium]|uniref:ATP-binding cassette domain-containing protein n=1 Tax=Eiseniibacteriota bacterium TaxID=2212470 RepID=A0A7V2F3M9_UNCEI|nr:ATP-binding cassette domain-containing protein [Candidatus Eisenbacteria bacterium]
MRPGVPDGCKGGKPLLEIRNVIKRYDGLTAVDDLSLTIEPGGVFGLLGPNGAGKTTTIRMIMGIIEPDEGEIDVFGEPFSEKTKERIGYLPEERGLYRKMKVIDHLVFLGEIKGIPAKTAAERAVEWMRRLDLAGWEQKTVESLSKGMQQKIQFISAVLHEPELMILDEPFTGLDPINIQLLKDIITEMKEGGRTIVLSTHLMDQVEKLCERICLINRGRAVLEGDLAEIKMRFSKNILTLRYSGDRRTLEAHPGVERATAFGREISVFLRDGADPNDVLRYAVERGRVERFEIGEMSLHDIFIAQVQEKVGEVRDEAAQSGQA